MPSSVNCSFIGKPHWQQSGLLSLMPGNNTIYVVNGVTANLLQLYPTCFALLDNAQQKRALKYYQLKDQQRYVIQHGLLRLLLGRYLNIPAAAIAFRYNQNQKPYLLAGNHQPCFFNLSHSAGQFLIAIGDAEMGVDIENIKPGFAYQDIAYHYFSADEVNYIATSSNPTEAFFLLWTRKEALLKACGNGIDDNLPAMPALDGPRNLPANYSDTNWLTESFYTINGLMGSLTYPQLKITVKFGEITTDAVAGLL